MSLYAIIDIETTGLNPERDEIIEIGIILMNGSFEEQYEFLIKPKKNLPLHIQAITGLKDEDLLEAPELSEVSQKIVDLIEDRVLIGHNMHFDFSFLKKVYKDAGAPLRNHWVCTAKYARSVVPKLPSYKLSSLVRSFKIEHEGFHRAMNDAVATLKLYKVLNERDELGVWDQMLKKRKSEKNLPVQVPRKVVDGLPKSAGVYYFKNQKGKNIYIGKAKNIQKRVLSHFSDTETQRGVDFKNEIAHIEYLQTGSELVAHLIEDSEIRHFWPKHNKAQKNPKRKYGVYAYQGRKDVWRLAINKSNVFNGAVRVFYDLYVARNWVMSQVEKYNLNPEVCGFGEFGLAVEIEDEEHNVNFQKFLDAYKDELRSFAVHVIMALSNDYFAIKAHPEMAFVRSKK